MRKVELFKFTAEITMLTKDGRLSIKIKLTRLPLKDLTKNSVLKSTDHSILSQICQ
jgi:hypothetical protein